MPRSCDPCPNPSLNPKRFLLSFILYALVVLQSRASSLRPKVFLVARLAHHRRRCRPLRAHPSPRKVCVPVSGQRPADDSDASLVTEIDFQTYLQQVDLVLKGERDYARLVGDTGPLVCVLLLPLVLSFLPYLNTFRSKLSSRPRPPPSRSQTYPRCHLTRHHPGHLRRPLPRFSIRNRLDIL